MVDNPKVLTQMLNNALRNVMRRLNYIELGKSGKYFDISNNSKKTFESLVMYSGFKSSFVNLEKGCFLRVNTAKKIVRNQNVKEFIDNCYKMHEGKEKDQKRALVEQELIGKIVMTNYGKARYYSIAGLQFGPIDNIMLENPAKEGIIEVKPRTLR